MRDKAGMLPEAGKKHRTRKEEGTRGGRKEAALSVLRWWAAEETRRNGCLVEMAV